VQRRGVSLPRERAATSAAESGLEAYICDIAKRFDEKGALSDKSTQEFLQKFMNAYADWVGRACNTSLS
jgi:hypothetical protein